MTATETTALAPTSLNELAKALSAAQGEIEAAAKGKENPHFRSRYADLASIWEACRAPLSKHGLAVVQQPLSSGDLVGLATTLLHSSGQFMRSEVWTKPQQPGPQALGSALTYLRRYSLAAVVGVAPDDDDGEAASGRGADPKADRPASTKAPAPAAPRANTVKHDGKKADPAAVKLLHVLRGKVGGLVVCDKARPCPYPNGKLCGYHTQLAAFKDAAGKPVRSSTDLSPEQIENLIGRYKRKIDEQAARAGAQPDIGAVIPMHSPTADELFQQRASSFADGEIKENILAMWGADHVIELDPPTRALALQALLAYSEGAEAFEAWRTKAGFRDPEESHGIPDEQELMDRDGGDR
jgi:hypothetical protein